MIKISFFTPFFLFFIWTADALAQTETYLALYKEQLPYFQELISGGQYQEPPLNYEGHPYYQSRTFGEGMLSINKITYTEVPLLYDENADMVVTFHPIYRQKILIKPEKIEEFQLEDGSVFRRFERKDHYSNHKNGFYRILKDGEIKVVLKHYKYTEPTNEIGKYTHRYEAQKQYFYLFNGDFVPINKKNQAIKNLGLSKREVKKGMKSQSLYFSLNREKYILELANIREAKSEPFNGFAQ